MKRFSIVFLLAVSIAFMFSCTSKSGKDLKDITEKETKFKEAGRTDIKMAVELDQAYKRYMMRYPADTNIPRMLFEDAQVNIEPIRKTSTALEQLNQLYTKYPDSRFAPNALFKAAFLNERLQRFDEAKKLFLLFISKYPNNQLVNDARESVAMLGMSDEEQFKKIREHKAAVEDSVKNQKKVNH